MPQQRSFHLTALLLLTVSLSQAFVTVPAIIVVGGGGSRNAGLWRATTQQLCGGRARTTMTRQTSSSSSRNSNIRLWGGTTTMEPPTTETQEKTTYTTSNNQDTYSDDNDDENYDDLEYLIDSLESREMEDPFHILLLGSTFEKPKITVSYVTGNLEYVLQMPRDEAKELSQFAHDEGMSCLGTWPREECLDLGRQLQRRDIVCRVVPFVEGGQRGWQAKDASSSSSSSSNVGSS